MDEPWKIALIAGAAAVVLLVSAVCVILLRKRKNKPAPRIDDRELIARNSKALEALVIIAGDNAEIICELRGLQEKLKYLIPSDNPKVIGYDKTIENKIGDLRIALTKSDGEVTKKATDIITDIKLAVADRNTRL